MPTISLAQRSPVSVAARQRLDGMILLATDGNPQSSGAFAAAVGISARVSRRTEGVAPLPVHVVTVSDALSVLTPEMGATLAYGHQDAQRAEMLSAASEQLRYHVADRSNWDVEVLSGPAAPTIVSAAADSGASLVVMGLGNHNLADRVFGTETALRVMQRSHIPVLAVPQNWIGIPRRVLIAVDFGPASLRAARTAMRIIAEGGSVRFAHVAPNTGTAEYDEQLAATYQSSLFEEFDRFIAAVGVPDDVTVTRTPLYGDTARALLDWATANSADLIVAGTHGVNPLARLLVGSVASKLVRGAHCAVLVAAAHDERDFRDAGVCEYRASV